jgi:hypothetical protein
MLLIGEIKAKTEFSEVGHVEKVEYEPSISVNSFGFQTAIFAVASDHLSSIRFTAVGLIPFHLSAERQIMTLWSWKASARVDLGITGVTQWYANLKVRNPDGSLITGVKEEWLSLPRNEERTPIRKLPAGDYQLSVELSLDALVQPNQTVGGRVIAALEQSNFQILDVT